MRNQFGKPNIFLELVFTVGESIVGRLEFAYDKLIITIKRKINKGASLYLITVIIRKFSDTNHG